MAKYLSIEIGSKSIEIVEGAKKGSSVTVNKYDCITTPDGSIDEGKILDIDALTTAIAGSLKSKKFSSKKAIFIINTGSVINRVLVLPVVKSNKDTMSMIKYELQQYMPINLDDYKIIFKIVDRFEEDGVKKAKYSIYALQSDIYESYILLAKKLRLTLMSVNLVFNNLDTIYTNNITINGNVNEKNKVIGFINIGYNSFNLSVLNKGVNDFSRTIPGGVSEIVERLKTEYDMDYDQTIMLLNNISLVDEIDIFSIDKSTVVREILAGWVNELNRYIKYYNSRSNDNSIQKLYVYGSHVYFKKLKEYLTRELGIETEIVEYITGLTINTISDEKFNIRLYFNSILGLYYNKNTVHFMTSEIKEHKKKFNLGLVFTAGILIVGCTFGYILLNDSLEKKYYNSEIANMKQFMEKPENIEASKESDDLKNKSEELKVYADNIQTVKSYIQSQDAVNTAILKDISANVPTDTKIASMIINNTTIQIQCTSLNRKSAAQFEKNMKGIAYIENVYIPAVAEMSEQESSKYAYSIVCTLKGAENNEAN